MKLTQELIDEIQKAMLHTNLKGEINWKDGDDIEMELSVNVRAIRNDTTKEDYVPVNISVVSVDSNKKEFDRDEFNYSQFLLKGSKIVDRATTFELKVPAGGKVFLGIK